MNCIGCFNHSRINQFGAYFFAIRVIQDIKKYPDCGIERHKQQLTLIENMEINVKHYNNNDHHMVNPEELHTCL